MAKWPSGLVGEEAGLTQEQRNDQGYSLLTGFHNLTICVSFQIFNTSHNVPTVEQEKYERVILTINTMNFCNPYLT